MQVCPAGYLNMVPPHHMDHHKCLPLKPSYLNLQTCTQIKDIGDDTTTNRFTVTGGCDLKQIPSDEHYVTNITLAAKRQVKVMSLLVLIEHDRQVGSELVPSQKRALTGGIPAGAHDPIGDA